MRNVVLLALTAGVAGCTAAPPQATAPTPQAQARLTELLAGKVAGQPQSCIPNWRSNDMIVIDDSTIIFRETASKMWLQKTKTPCSQLSGFSYALVTRSTTSDLCSGEIAQVYDNSMNQQIGSCILGDFVPYRRSGS